jgi:hypothetical protein
VRPLLEHEVAANEPLAVFPDVGNNVITVQEGAGKRTSTYPYDHVFPSKISNREVYKAVGKPLVAACMNGFNGTLMAYGQTSTGKTTTLSSPDGIVPLAIRHLFRRMARLSHRYSYKISISYLQIYQERIYDLLGDVEIAADGDALGAGGTTELLLREHPEHGIFVEGLSEHIARNESEVTALLERGKSRLIFSETKMNRHSSRSHAICMINVERSSARNGLNSSIASRASFHTLPTSLSTSNIGLATRNNSPKPFLSAAMRNKSLFSSNDTVDENPSDEELDMSFSSTTPADDEMMVRGRLTLCDLAGSERIKKTLATGQQLSEAKEINLSLLELGNVIQALAESKKHIPFRNASLTRLLQESLGGNCVTSLIVCGLLKRGGLGGISSNHRVFQI